ncbi:MAG: PfkB family carbohydrate kinase, partial [Candidatus Omnitrophica bacterium]|nr:PfkB family carbohydrate kinase [Candidatus Omnitrophota bacterium]
FDENIALVALTGKKESETTEAWESDFFAGTIIAALIRSSTEDVPAAIYNIIDGETLPGMFGWADALSKETVEEVNREAMAMLERMGKGPDNVWMVLSAGGPLHYDRGLDYYASLIKKVKGKYRDRVKLLIDFKFMAGPLETMSVLNVHRDTPQDIIKPNVEEFLKILVASGLAGAGILDKTSISEAYLKKYAARLRKKYNLLGVLISMDKNGLMLVMKDLVIREAGIVINQICPTGAGDSLKAGFLYALSKGKSFEAAVHTANLFGAATASMEGTKTVTPDTFARTKALAIAQGVRPEVEYLK